MLLKGQNIRKDYGIQELIDIKNIEINDYDRIGVVGKNGAGKSTLLKILIGELPCDEGIITRNCEISYIRQTGEVKDKADGNLISQMNLRKSEVKSGGEKTRLAIAAAFSKQAPLLFADEPTTNLDVEGILKLEKMLLGYRGAVVLISHDRALLNHVCNQIWEMDHAKLRVFHGNYEEWLEQKKRERDYQKFEYDQYISEKKRLQASINKKKQKAKKMKKPPTRMGSSEWILHKGTASIKQGSIQNSARALNSRMEQLGTKEKPKELPHVSLKLAEAKKIKAKVAAKVENLSVWFEEKKVLDDVNFSVLAGKKTILIGENGSGKTTLIQNLITNRNNSFLTSDAKIGYFSQTQEDLKDEKTVLENVLSTATVPEHICRAVLMNLCMEHHDMNKKVKILSGGERVKTAIAKVLVSNCNFLILDEPTNHMDVYTMEGLEQLLSSYDGTVLMISHDRKMAFNIADDIYEIKNKKIKQCSIEELKRN